MRWFAGFVLHYMVTTMLSVIAPIHLLQRLEGTILDAGVAVAATLLAPVPFFPIWGFLCDRARSYRPFVLFSFSSTAILIYLLFIANSVSVFILLYTLVGILRAASEPPKNVLLSELYPTENWEGAYGFSELWTKLGQLAGILLALAASGLGSLLLLFCASVELVAFLLSFALVRDPFLVIQRKITRIGRTIDALCGLIISYRYRPRERILKVSASALYASLFLFFLSAGALALVPVFVLTMTGSESAVFIASFFSVLGATFGSALAKRAVGASGLLRKAALLRGLLALPLATLASPPTFNLALVVIALLFLGFTYELFFIPSISLYMELAPEGRAGVYGTLSGLGLALGSLTSAYFVQEFNFQAVFLAMGAGFFITYLILKIGLGKD